MAKQLTPAHRTRDGQPIKTTDVARTPTRPRARICPRLCARLHAHVHARDHTCEEAD